MVPARLPSAYPFGMSEIWIRTGLVIGALAAAGIIALIQRRRAAAPVRSVKTKGLAPGVYFFSSATCSTCDQAREKLESSLGADGYTEFAWDLHPDMFTELGIDQVPAVVIVDDAGRGRLHLGQPDRALDP